MFRIALVLVACVASAAEPAKPQEIALKSTSLAKKESRLVATVPAGFTAEVMPMTKFGSVIENLKVESADHRTQLMITLMPPNDFLPRDAAGLEATVRQNCAGFVDESVEGKLTPFPLKLANGIGVATTLTDKSEVGKPVPKLAGHYKVMTSGMICVGDSTLAVVTLFGDTKDGPGADAALKIVETLRVGK